MNDTKKIGRPRGFDEQTALKSAMNAFWTKGYDGTSMKDLTQVMGVSGPSIYSAFGDKRELYLKTIDHYGDVDGCAPVIAFEAEPDVFKAVKDFLITVVSYSTQQEGGPKGCYLASCVATTVGVVDGVAERMEKAIHDTDARLAQKFEAAVAKGDLRPDFPCLQRARLLHDMRQGFVHRSRAGWSADTLLEDIDDRVRMVLS